MAISKRITDAFDSRTLAGLVDPDRRITNGVRGPDWQDSEYKLIRLQDCKDWVVDAANAASISFDQFQDNRRCRLEPEDIVVAIGGYVGNAAVFLGGAKAVIGQHSAVLPARKNGPADSRFLLTYLNSSYGEALFQRYVSGTVQPGVNLEDLRELPAPLPNKAAQKYIGDKVRKAERLRTLAKSLAVSAKALVESLVENQINESRLIDAQQALDLGDDSLDLAILASLKADDIAETGEPSMFSERVLPSALADRLDASFYRPGYLRRERLLKHRGAVPLRLLVKGIACGPFGGNAIADELYADKGVMFVRPVNISSSFFDDSSVVRVPRDLLSKSGLKVYRGANLYFGRVGFPCVALIDAETSISPNIIIVQPNCAKADPAYLYAFCASRAGMDQLHRQLKEVAQPTTSTDAVKEFLVLACDVAAQKYIGEKVRQAERLRVFAKSLAASARALVEALIGSQLSESQLIAAQQALEAGDDSFDRTILARFKTDGIDGTGEPLFPDLDQLYDLLKRATREATADGV